MRNFATPPPSFQNRRRTSRQSEGRNHRRCESATNRPPHTYKQPAIATAEAQLSQEEMTIILKLLPFDNREFVGVTGKNAAALIKGGSTHQGVVPNRAKRNVWPWRRRLLLISYASICFGRSREIFIVNAMLPDLRSSWLDSECVSTDCSIRPWSSSQPEEVGRIAWSMTGASQASKLQSQQRGNPGPNPGGRTI